MEQRNQVELSVLENETHLSLNILDIISFTGRLKLDYLGDDVATEIVTAYNEHVEETLHIQIGLSERMGEDTKDLLAEFERVKTLYNNITKPNNE